MVVVVVMVGVVWVRRVAVGVVVRRRRREVGRVVAVVHVGRRGRGRHVVRRVRPGREAVPGVVVLLLALLAAAAVRRSGRGGLALLVLLGLALRLRLQPALLRLLLLQLLQVRGRVAAATQCGREGWKCN